LSWKTPSENQMDRVVHGTSNRGEQHPLAKLTEADVRAIRRLGQKLPSIDIATRFGVTRECVRDILSGLRWGWLE
jgi:DNA-binding GntR family transcriptional regulator